MLMDQAELKIAEFSTEQVQYPPPDEVIPDIVVISGDKSGLHMKTLL